MTPEIASASPTMPPAAPERSFGGPPLAGKVVWAAVAFAAVLPAILLSILVLLVAALQYNFLNWME